MSELTTTSRPYAKAVFELAKEDGKLTDWSDSLSFMGAVARNEDVIKVMKSPRMTRTAKADAFVALCDGRLDDKQQNLVKLLSEYNRLDHLPVIASLFENLKDDEEGSVEVVVTSSQEMSKDEVKRVADAMTKRLGREVKIKTNIDASILSGMIIRAGDMVIDGSLQGRLNKMNNALNG